MNDRPSTTSVGDSLPEPVSIADEANKLKTAVTEEAAETSVKIKEEACAAAGHLRDAGRRFAETQATALSGKLGEYAGAVSSLCDKLNESGESNLLSGPAESAAGQLTKLSAYLKDAGPEEILHGLEGLARRKPELFFGGLFMAGLMAARFLKASGSRAALRERNTEQPRTGRSYTSSAALKDSAQPITSEL